MKRGGSSMEWRKGGFPEVWAALMRDILDNGARERNSRTGQEVAIYPGTFCFELDVSDGLLPTCGLRKTSPRTAAAEAAWMVLGHDHLAWLGRYTKIWDKFAELVDPAPGAPPDCLSVDGKVHVVRNAYGHRMRRHFRPQPCIKGAAGSPRDQLAALVDALREDPSNRQTWVSVWDPAVDGLGAKGAKNTPCYVGFTANVIGGALHVATTLRSSDVFVGLPYDVMALSILATVLAGSIGVALGTVAFTLANAHLYESHWDLARVCLAQPVVDPRIPMLRWRLENVEGQPNEFVRHYTEAARASQWPSFNPKPEVWA